MKKVSNHLGEIIVALACVALVISAISVFNAPISNFFAGTTNKLVALGNQLIGGINSDIEIGVDGEGSGSSSTSVKSIAHRGYSLVAPENSLHAYSLAKENGFNYVETDVTFTSDNIAVLSHDDTINKVARNTDGSTISETIAVKDVTYSELLNYDFGIYQGSKYAGTKITTLEEFLSFCANKGLKPYIEVRWGITKEQIKIIDDMVKKYGINKDVTYLSVGAVVPMIVECNDEARIGFLTNSQEINNDLISEVESLKTEKNEVFLDFNYVYLDNNEIQLCKEANLPLEVYTVNDTTVIKNLDPYISGVTSDCFDAKKIKYENSSKPESPYLSDYEIVKVLNSSDISYKVTASNYYPYSHSNTRRACYINFDIPVEEGYIYKFEFDSSVDTAKMGIHLFTDVDLQKVELDSPAVFYKDLGWQNSGFTKEISYSTDGCTYKAVRFVFCMTTEEQKDVVDGFINSVTISRKSI